MVDLLQTVLVQNLGSSLVREYLFRTGLKCTLKCMDDELPRSPESFNNRILLARELNIEHLLQEYKQINCPAKSVLEIMLCVFLKKREVFVPEIAKKHIPYNSLDNWSKICQAVTRSSRTSVQRSQMVNIDRMQWFYRQLSDRGVKIDFQTLVLIYCDCFGNELQSYSDEDTTEGQDCQVPRKFKDVHRQGFQVTDEGLPCITQVTDEGLPCITQVDCNNSALICYTNRIVALFQQTYSLTFH